LSAWLGDALPHARRVPLAGGAGHRPSFVNAGEGLEDGAGGLGTARPQAGFGEVEFYPDPYDKAAVLCCRLAWNHPLPDGNKRAAWACLLLFVDLNDGRWDPDPPSVDDAESAMLAVAARDVDEAWFATWLRDRVVLPPAVP
jgi:prophage maintenance system killer protein